MSPGEGSGRRQKPRFFGQREQFMNGRVQAPALELNPSLLTDAFIGFRGSSRRPPREGQRKFGQSCQSVDTPAMEFVNLEPRYARDETEMVVIVAALVADRPPAADVALRDRLGVGGDIAGAVDGCLELPLYKPMVRQEVVGLGSSAVESPRRAGQHASAPAGVPVGGRP